MWPWWEGFIFMRVFVRMPIERQRNRRVGIRVYVSV